MVLGTRRRRVCFRGVLFLLLAYRFLWGFASCCWVHCLAFQTSFEAVLNPTLHHYPKLETPYHYPPNRQTLVPTGCRIPHDGE